MESSNRKLDREQLFCPIRKKWVANLPEEFVRQELVKKMVELQGFPLSSLALEKELSQIPHLALSDKKIPDRRADLICFAKGIHPSFDLYPLLLVECKAIDLNSKVINQVLGYNFFLGARFVAVANQKEIRLGWLDKTSKTYKFINYLPNYEDLVGSLKKNRI